MTRKTKKTLDDLCLMVCKEFRTSPEKVRSRTKEHPTLFARKAFVWLAVWFAWVSKLDAGTYVGVTKGAIDYVLRKVNDEIETNPKFKAATYRIAKKLDPEFKGELNPFMKL